MKSIKSLFVCTIRHTSIQHVQNNRNWTFFVVVHLYAPFGAFIEHSKHIKCPSGCLLAIAVLFHFWNFLHYISLILRNRVKCIHFYWRSHANNSNGITKCDKRLTDCRRLSSRTYTCVFDVCIDWSDFCGKIDLARCHARPGTQWTTVYVARILYNKIAANFLFGWPALTLTLALTSILSLRSEGHFVIWPVRMHKHNYYLWAMSILQCIRLTIGLCLSSSIIQSTDRHDTRRLHKINDSIWMSRCMFIEHGTLIAGVLDNFRLEIYGLNFEWLFFILSNSPLLQSDIESNCIAWEKSSSSTISPLSIILSLRLSLHLVVLTLLVL